METSHKNFVPHTELILFAADFSKNYNYLDAGNYRSTDKKYHIELNHIADFGAPEWTVWRIDHLSHKIQIGIEWLQDTNINKDFIFFMIIWSGCLIHYKDTLGITDFERADRETMLYYKTTFRNLKNVVDGFNFMLTKLGNSDICKKRIDFMNALISEHEVSNKRDFSYTVDRANKTLTFYPMHLSYKPYHSFLDGTLKPWQIKFEHLFVNMVKVAKNTYMPRGYKILFFFKNESTRILD